MSSSAQSGRFHGSHHLALLAHLARSGRSGTLEIKASPSTAWITFLSGRVTWAETNDKSTTAGQVLRDAGMLGTDQLRAIEADAPDEDSLMERIAEELGRTRSDLEPWRQAAVRARLAAGVGWGEGKWRFTPADDADVQGIDPRLLPQIDLVRIGWEAVLAWVDEARARREVLDPTAGPLMAGPDFDHAIDQLRLPPALVSLRARVKAQVEPARLVAELGDRSPELVRILWLLEYGGWAVRRDRPNPLFASETATAEAPTAPVQPADPVIDRATSLWENRHNSDLYDLLGVRPYASTASVARAANDLMRDLTRLAEDSRRPEGTRTIARNLLAAAQIARSTLSDDGRRTDYDADRKAGRSPTVAKLLAGLSTDPGNKRGGPLAQALEALEKGDLLAAAAGARRAIFLEPDDPDVLAESAWILWSARMEVPLEEQPEEYIHRALARHPGHDRAREVRDLIANQRAAGQGTRRTLMGWLRSRS